MENDNKKLPLLKPSIAFAALLFILTVLFFIASSFSDQRKKEVYNAYAKETQEYIGKNKQGLNVLFNEIFLPCPAPDYYSSCTSPKSTEIPGVITPDLKDWSSTIFIKLMNEKIYYMRLSGDISTYYYSYDSQKAALEKLLRGEVDEIAWDDYTSELPNKEVVIAVKDDAGKVIGAIMRGVIEERSF